jgi:hypothetical protein
MANNITNEVNVFVNDFIVPGVVDGVFKNDPLLAFLRANRLNVYPGGRQIQENFRYKPLIGGPYAKGATFDLSKRRTSDAGQFDLRHHQVNVTEFLEEIDIESKGPNAVFSLLQNDLEAAAQTMSAILAIELYNSDQGSTAIALNGLPEIISDGSSASFDGSTYTTYGGVTRSSVNNALDGTITQVSGAITYKQLEESYNDLVLGDVEPNLIVTTNRGMSYIKQRFHPQYRITQQEPTIGFTGVQFNKATILQSQYAPGTQGTNDSDLGNYLDASGETLWMLVTDALKMWVTDSKLFGFGFSGFKWSKDSTIVSGQYFASVNITCQAPRLMAQLYDITG